MTKFRKYRRAIMGTLAGLGIWLAAILSFQPAVTPPVIPLWNSGVKEWTLTNDYTTSITVSGVVYTVTIKDGFRTDGASIPDPLAPPLGLTRDAPSIIRGALVHDSLYESQLVDRETADSILYAACLKDGTDPDKAAAVWLAVHEWGFVVWDRYTPESVYQARKLVSVSERVTL
jgi:hypothetical protein